MKDVVSRNIESIRGALEGAISRRLMVVIPLAVALLFILVWGWSAARRPEYRFLMNGRERDLYALQALLDASGVSWRSRPLGEGRLGVEVRAGADFQKAYRIARDQGFLFGPSSAPLSLDEGSGLFTPPERLRLRIEESRIRRVEESILFNPNITSVRLMISRSEPGLLSGEPPKIAASVGLQLRPETDLLSPSEVKSIRDLVRGAFGIEPADIHVVDHKGRSYERSLSPAVLDIEERTRKRIEDVVELLYLGQYRPWEFRLGVMVNVSSRDSRTEEVRFDPESTFSVPRAIETPAGDGEAVREEQEVLSSKTETTTKIPPGEVIGVGVNLVLDLEAVRRALERKEALGAPDPAGASGKPSLRPSLRERVREYEKEQEELLARQLPFPDTRVEVSAEVLSAAASRETSLPAGGDRAARHPWLALSGGAGATGLAGVLILLRRRRKAKAHRAASTAGESPGDLTACRDTLELARRAGESVRERSEVAASILRLWLASGDEHPEGLGENGRSRVAGLPALEPGREGLLGRRHRLAPGGRLGAGEEP